MNTEKQQLPDLATAQAQLVAANDLRESRDYQGALKAGSTAVDAFLALGNGVKAAEAASTRALAFRNWANEQNDSEQHEFLLEQALAEARDAVRIGEESKNPEALAIPSFNLAKVYEDMGNLEAAVVMYEKSVLNALPDELRKKPGVSADMHRHLALALLPFVIEQGIADENDIETLLNTVEENRSEIAKMPDVYEKYVWLSGVDRGLARFYLSRGDRDKATEHTQNAMRIIMENITRFPNLETRRQQMEKFAHDEGLQLG